MRVIIYDGGVQVTPIPGGLLNALRYTYRTQEVSGYRKRWVSRKIDLFTRQGDSVLTYPGFTDKVCEYMRLHHPDAKVIDGRSPLPEPAYDNLQPLRGRQDEALATLLSYHNGILKMPTGSGKSFLIGQLLRLFPESRTLITTPSLSILDDLFRRCCEAVEDLGICVGMHSSKRKTDSQKLAKVPARSRTEPTVMVMSTGSLPNIDPDWPDILLFDEVHEAATGSRGPILVPFLGCRMYGFSATPFGRPDGADAETEAFFGPVRYAVEYREGVTSDMVVPIHVTMLRVVVRDFPEYSADHMRQRFGYWLNEARNNAAMRYVHAHYTDDDQVLFLVRTVEHAVVLQELTGYPICYSSITPSTWLNLHKNGHRPLYTPEELQQVNDWVVQQRSAEPPRTFRSVRKAVETAFLEGAVPCEAFLRECKCDVNAFKDAFREGGLHRLIATTVFKQGVDFPRLNCLVRMDGMTGSIPSIQIGGRTSRKNDGKESGEVVDFLDDYGDYYLGRSYTRRTEYEKAGWTVRDV